MDSQTIDKRIKRLRKALQQDIVVHIGATADGALDILGVECAGDQLSKTQQRPEPAPKSGSKTKGDTTYIG